MKHYELFYLISATIPETGLDTVSTAITALITEQGGNIIKQENWGRKKLAYPINNERNGYYLLVQFDMESGALKELERKLKLATTMLRYIVVERDIPSEQDIAREQIARKRQQTLMAERRNKAEEKSRDADKEEAVERNTTKIKLDDLDKKLDELLDQDIIN